MFGQNELFEAKFVYFNIFFVKIFSSFFTFFKYFVDFSTIVCLLAESCLQCKHPQCRPYTVFKKGKTYIELFLEFKKNVFFIISFDFKVR